MDAISSQNVLSNPFRIYLFRKQLGMASTTVSKIAAVWGSADAASVEYFTVARAPFPYLLALPPRAFLERSSPRVFHMHCCFSWLVPKCLTNLQLSRFINYEFCVH
jgi:hypothetical protein